MAAGRKFQVLGGRLEGLRTGRVVRVRPGGWPQVQVPREEYFEDGGLRFEERFPTPAIFPKY